MAVFYDYTFLLRVHPTHFYIIHLTLQRDQLPFPWELQGLNLVVFFRAPANTGNGSTRKATT